MENLQTLKLELISQKVAIENKGGTVTVVNTNPSPSEITAGIKTIPNPDLTEATATEEDVAFGKTFYSGNSTLKTGTKEVPDLTLATATESDVIAGKTFFSGNDTIKTGTKENEIEKFSKIFLSSEGTGETIYITIPDGIKNLKTYLLYDCEDKIIDITFNSDIEGIGDYDFYKCVNASFSNFASLTNIKNLGTYSFGLLTQYPIDLENLPTSIDTLGTRCFYNSVKPNTSIKLHNSITSIGNYCYATLNKQEMNELIIPNDINLTELPGYMLENLIFNCDLRIPATVTSLAMGFAYGCSFNNITIPATCKTVGNAAFYCKANEAASYRKLKTVTFESSVPPTFSTYVFAEQDKTNGFKIYVPDNAVDTYKAVARLASFVNHIYPISQKE